MQEPRQTSSSSSFFFFPLSLFVTNNGSKTYGNPFLTLFILFFLFPYFISFLFLSFPFLLFFFFFSSPLFFRNSTSTCLAWERGKLGVARRRRRGGNRRQWPPRRTKRFQQLSRRIVLIIVTSCKRSQAVLESLTQIPMNVGRNEWSLRKSFFRTTSRDADPCFLPVRESPPSSSMLLLFRKSIQRHNPFFSFVPDADAAQKSDHRPSNIEERIETFNFEEKCRSKLMVKYNRFKEVIQKKVIQKSSKFPQFFFFY